MSRAAFAVEVALARGAARLIRATGRGGGTTLPGRALLKMAPDALGRLRARIPGPITVVSATNGKTTTAALLSSILAADGREPVHNRAGSNMAWGVATAMLSQRGSEGLFEVDEAWLGEVAGALRPDVFLLCNLFRDQLDRYGELESLATGWHEVLDRTAATPADGHAFPAAGSAAGPAIVLNADDPLLADLGRDADGTPRARVTYFGVDDASVAPPGESMAHDAKHCRRCGAAYTYTATLLGHLGHYRCPGCGAERPRPAVVATEVELRGMDGTWMAVSVPGAELEIELSLPGLYNAYNALAARAAAVALGVEPRLAAQALARTEAAFGRTERVEIGERALEILLIKNPVGATEVLRTLAFSAPPAPGAAAAESTGLDLWIALNDGIADGRDISWIWDAEFEQLAGRVRRVTCSGTRAEELALRLVYAGIDRESLVIDRDPERSLDSALDAAGDRLYALPTYTALLGLQALLARRGLIAGYLR